MPVSARQQQVLNLALPAAWDYIFQAMHSILDEYPIDYIKWDHNRDLLDAASTASGQAAVHENTSAVYRLMEALKEHHPGGNRVVRLRRGTRGPCRAGQDRQDLDK